MSKTKQPSPEAGADRPAESPRLEEWEEPYLTSETMLAIIEEFGEPEDLEEATNDPEIVDDVFFRVLKANALKASSDQMASDSYENALRKARDDLLRSISANFRQMTSRDEPERVSTTQEEMKLDRDTPREESGENHTYPGVRATVEGIDEEKETASRPAMAEKSDSIGPRELDARLEAVEARMDKRVEEIHGDLRESFAELKAQNNNIQGRLGSITNQIWTVAAIISATIIGVFTIYIVSFDSGRDTAISQQAAPAIIQQFPAMPANSPSAGESEAAQVESASGN